MAKYHSIFPTPIKHSVNYINVILPGMYQKEFKKNEKCVFFGKMRRYRNNTMMPLTSQRMMANLGNTILNNQVPQNS